MTNTVEQGTVTLKAIGGHVFARVTDSAGAIVREFATADTAGLVRRLDRQMKDEGIVRDGYGPDMSAVAYIMRTEV